MYDIQTRTIPARDVLSINQHVHSPTHRLLRRGLRPAARDGPGLDGIEGAPYLVFYGEVSDDSDGPFELCRPIASTSRSSPTRPATSHRAVHDEVFIRLTKRDMGWPAMLPAVDALEAWVTEHARQPAGPLRQVLIADQRTASADTPVCDLTIPLRARAATTATI